MLIYDILHKKRLGQELSDDEIHFFINAFTQNDIPDYQASALLMAICINGMSEHETSVLTDAMTNSGDIVDLSSISGIKVDKHSTGGVGDKTSLVVCPIVAACGVPVAKMSGRGLGHTGGTLDKLEAIPGMNISLSMDNFLENVQKIGFSLIGQTGNVAPADKKLYALRDVTATVDSIPLIASSIMSKKLASGANAIVLDVKTGSGAFMKNIDSSIALARAMVNIGCRMGRETSAIISNMDIPLGNAVGNSLEVIEAVNTLRGSGPADLLELSLALASSMLSLGLKKPQDECRKAAIDAVRSGKAFEKLCEMVKAQGGDINYLINTNLFPRASVCLESVAEKSGYISHIDCELIGSASCTTGAGRAKLEDEIDYSAGIMLCRKSGDKVNQGDIIAKIYSCDRDKAAQAHSMLNHAVTISHNPPKPTKLIYASVDHSGIEMF